MARAATRPTGTNPTLSLREVLPLDGPTALADPPGPGPVFVTTQGGRVYAVNLDTAASDLVLDLSDRTKSDNENGLLGIAVPADASRMYISYNVADGDVEVRSWPLVAGRPDGIDGVLHLRIGKPFDDHNGGNLAFGPDGALWFGTGDGGGLDDKGNVAQNVHRLLGKMLRIVPNPAGGVFAPDTNPDWGGRPEVWGIGLRNPWRWSFDRATNRLWVADVGLESMEELTVVDPGNRAANFGWSTVEGTHELKGKARPEYLVPQLTYRHDEGGCAIVGGFVYRGDAIPGLYGWYLYGDYCGGFIRAVPANDPSSPPVQLAISGEPIRSFAELESGELLVLTSDEILAIEP